MSSLIEFIERRKLAFWISLSYVGLGTLAVCSVYPADTFFGSWSLWGVLITLPVCVTSFGYRFAEADTIYPVFIIQAVMFILMFFILSSFLRRKKETEDQYDEVAENEHGQIKRDDA